MSDSGDQTPADARPDARTDPATDRVKEGAGGEEYTGPGAWGPAALWLLGGLFLIAVVATVHSVFATFGG